MGYEKASLPSQRINAIEKLYNKISSDNDLMAVGCHLEYMDSKGGKMQGGIYLGETTKEGFYEKNGFEKHCHYSSR